MLNTARTNTTCDRFHLAAHVAHVLVGWYQVCGQRTGCVWKTRHTMLYTRSHHCLSPMSTFTYISTYMLTYTTGIQGACCQAACSASPQIQHPTYTTRHHHHTTTVHCHIHMVLSKACQAAGTHPPHSTRQHTSPSHIPPSHITHPTPPQAACRAQHQPLSQCCHRCECALSPCTCCKNSMCGWGLLALLCKPCCVCIH